MPPDDAIHLLLTSSSYDANVENTQIASKIVETLGYLPLAITHAASYISLHHRLSTFLEVYSQSRAAILARNNSMIPQDYNLSVATTIEMSFNRLSEQSRDFLRLLSFFHVGGVARSIISRAGKNGFDYINTPLRVNPPPRLQAQAKALAKILSPIGVWSEYAFDELIVSCQQYSLLRHSLNVDDDVFYSMHVLVRSWIQDQLNSEQNIQFGELAARLLASSINRESFYIPWLPGSLVLNQVKQLPQNIVALPEDHYQFGGLFYDAGDNLTTKILAETAIQQLEASGEVDELGVLDIKAKFVWVLSDMGRYQDAVKLATVVLNERKRFLGGDHPETLWAMAGLAMPLWEMGRLDEAFDLRKQVLEKPTSTLGEEHPDTLTAMNNYGLSLHNAGRYEESLALWRLLAEKQERVFGPDHPVTLTSMAGIANTLTNLSADESERESNLQSAIKILRNVLEKEKTALGEEHPQRLKTLGNLAVTLSASGEYQEALEILESLLETYRRLGQEDQMTAYWLSVSMGGILEQMGRIEEAKVAYRRGLDGIESVSGADSRSTEHPRSRLQLIEGMNSSGRSEGDTNET